jgi:hypothetical protein
MVTAWMPVMGALKHVPTRSGVGDSERGSEQEVSVYRVMEPCEGVEVVEGEPPNRVGLAA